MKRILEPLKGRRDDEATYLAYTHKRCGKCKAVKPVDEFYRRTARTVRGWAWSSFCCACSRDQCREYGSGAKASRNDRLRRWRQTNPSKAAAVDKRKRLRKYGLAPADLERMRESQGGRCAICLRVKTKLVVDHCHVQGHVRALLCTPCNTFLGWYEQQAPTIQRFREYVERHRKP